MSMICVGNSHIVAISKGAALAGKEIVEFRLREMKKSEKLTQKALEEQVGHQLVAAVQKHQAQKVYCFCGGGMHVALGLIQHPLRFDFIMPDGIDRVFDDTATLVPFDAIRSLMAFKIRKHLRLLRYLSEIVPAKLVQHEPPPPVADGAFLREAAATYDPDAATYGISAPHLRLKLWQLHNQLFREFCASNNIEYVINPSEVFDGDGFLAEPYWGDYVHGNAQYGAAVLHKLEELRP